MSRLTNKCCKIVPGDPSILGATWDGEGVNFALFSAGAEHVELSLFEKLENQTMTEVARIALPEQENQIWHGYIPKAKPGLHYGYRVSGEWNPHQGKYFNSHNLLIDPYAKALSAPLCFHENQLDNNEHPRAEDNSQVMPKGVVTMPFDTEDKRGKPNTPWNNTILYELHVKGFSYLHPDVPEPFRGRFSALTTPPLLEYLKSLGITAVELLPIFSFTDEQHLARNNLNNYWGYNSINFFAPDPRYLTNPTAIEEFRSVVRQFHDAGIEVILDVVYNHTAEGGVDGPTLSYRGIDNLSYYRLNHDNLAEYNNDAGCGNTLDFSNPHVIRLVMDSLRYWSESMEVDGFRFDLAVTLARDSGGNFSPAAPLMTAIDQDPALNTLKLIAEPWDIGNNGYQLGNFPPGWSEWNDVYRDNIRGFWKGNPNHLGNLGKCLTASADCFDRDGRAPQASINQITAHDGFTLHDLVSYTEKHNLANKEDNNDGTNNNQSWNCGIEGESDDPDICSRRIIDKRNLLTTLLLSHGVPMLLAGDEFGRSQGGNNNAYCQDNVMSWLDWHLLEDEENLKLQLFVKQLIKMRHSLQFLQRKHFFPTPNYSGGYRDRITWFAVNAEEMTTEGWEYYDARQLTIHCCSHGEDAHPVDAILILINGSADIAQFKLPDANYGDRWVLKVDTSQAAIPPDSEQLGVVLANSEIRLEAQSMLMLQIANAD